MSDTPALTQALEEIGRRIKAARPDVAKPPVGDPRLPFVMAEARGYNGALAVLREYAQALHADVGNAERDVIARVNALAEPMGEYHHYAVELDDGVHFAVLVDDLRAALEATP